MRIAAGVLLILASVFNLFGGCGYALGGGAAVAMGAAGGAIAEGMREQQVEATAVDTQPSKALTDDAVTDEQLNAMQTASTVGKAAGGGLFLFGLFLLVLFGLQIAGGVLLFLQRTPVFVLVVGALGVFAELAGVLMTSIGITNILGTVGSLLAIAAALEIKKSLASAVPSFG